eukprot:4096418-Prymnesium_polylepis.1
MGSTVELWLLLTLQWLAACAFGDGYGQRVVLIAWAVGRVLFGYEELRTSTVVPFMVSSLQRLAHTWLHGASG